MKKVLHLLASNTYSGAENVVCTIIENFRDEYNMIYCSPKGKIQTILQNKNIEYCGIEKLNLKNIKRVIKKNKPDIIHAHDYKASLLIALSGYKGKIISHLHINAEFAKKWNLKTIAYSAAVNKFSNIIGVSDSIINEAIFKDKIKDKYRTIYNYVDKESIISKSKEKEYLEKYDLFYIGRLNELKNPIEFIEIIKEIKKEKGNITAVIIGDGELKQRCEFKIKEYNLEKNITMLGFIDNPFPIIKNCKIGIMPSKVEGFGLTVIESMILNKPVLNSGVGGLKEIFRNNTEYICENILQYVKKAIKLLEKTQDVTLLTSQYILKEEWKDKLKRVYE